MPSETWPLCDLSPTRTPSRVVTIFSLRGGASRVAVSSVTHSAFIARGEPLRSPFTRARLADIYQARARPSSKGTARIHSLHHLPLPRATPQLAQAHPYSRAPTYTCSTAPLDSAQHTSARSGRSNRAAELTCQTSPDGVGSGCIAFHACRRGCSTEGEDPRRHCERHRTKVTNGGTGHTPECTTQRSSQFCWRWW